MLPKKKEKRVSQKWVIFYLVTIAETEMKTNEWECQQYMRWKVNLFN